MAGLLNIVPRYLPRYGMAPEWSRAVRPLALAFGLITLVFAYTTVANIIEGPDGVKIASFFIAAILVTSLISRVTRATELRVTEVDLTGARPHVFFDWTEGNPVAHLLRFLIFGSGEVAPVTREVLREAEPDPQQRPSVHVA